MEPFDAPSRPRRADWSPAGGPGELDDGLHDAPVDDYPAGDYVGDRARRPKRRNLVWRWRRLFFLIGLLVMAVLAGGVAVMAQTKLPRLDDLQQASFICTVETAENCNSENAMSRLSSEENRENVRLEDVPDHLVQAVVSAEDRTFYEHTGIDPVGIARALYRDVRAGGLTQGGSTITQQLVKNRYLTHERSLNRKLEEALLAVRIEQEMSKDQILEEYLNTIYLGRNTYGVQAASQAYFGVDVHDIDKGQAAYLAGLIRAPELADPDDDPEEAERRRRTVLDALLEEGYITEDEHTLYDAVAFTPPYVLPGNAFRQTTSIWPEGDAAGAQYINTYVRGEALRILRSRGYEEEEARALIDNGGLRIYTTIDRGLQVQAYDAIYHPEHGALNQEGDPSGSLVSLNRQGQVVALVGGKAGAGQDANHAVVGYGSGGRPVGSTFKPIALAEAVSRSYSMMRSSLPAPGTTVIDPGDLPCEPWEVSNYDEEDAPSGSFNLVEATQYSSNTAYGALMKELGPDNVTSMAERLGMDSELSECLPTVLGADNSYPLEMAEVYSTFASRGMHREPSVITRIEQIDQGGEVDELYEWELDEDQVLTAEQADLVNYALQRVVEDGTGQGANIGRPVAGKTGTTSSNRDAWFVGYTPGESGLTTAVWMGHPEANWLDEECLAELDAEQGPALDPAQQEERVVDCTVIPPMNSSGVPVHGMASVTGGSLPADIFRTFMSGAQANNEETFTEPPPELLSQGTRLGGDGGYDSGEGGATPSVTTGPGPGGPQPTGPSTSVTEPGEETTTTGSTSTTTPDTTDPNTSVTIWPPSTGPPGNGGGNN